MWTLKSHVHLAPCYTTPPTPQGVIRKHAENYRELVSLGTSGGPPPGVTSPYEAGMKRIREYQDMCAKNQVQQQQQQQQLRPQASSALMEVMSDDG